MNKLRSIRRYHHQRMLDRAKRLYPDHPRYFTLAEVRTPCSCSFCGLKRKFWGPTLKERQHAEGEIIEAELQAGKEMA